MPQSVFAGFDDWQARRLPRPQTRDGDHRTPYQRDKARILHSAAFRRLQAKTQVLGVGISDFYRTRLTHSLEAAQIGTGIAAQLQQKYPDIASQVELDINLIEALCLAHDIGHPPFGHGGEIALHYMMIDHGGFEGNGQTFRIITKLEPYTAEHGMNLCRRTILGLIKYPNFINALENKALRVAPTASFRQVKASDWHPPKGLFNCDQTLFDWVLSPLCNDDRKALMQIDTVDGQHGKTKYKSFDCSIMELADDIAYAIHDLEDAIVMNMVELSDFQQEIVAPIEDLQIPWLSSEISQLARKLFTQEQYIRKNAIGALVNAFITAIEITNIALFEQPLLRYNASLPAEYRDALSLFKRFVYKQVISKPEVQMLEYKGQQIIMELFEAFNSDPERLLPNNTVNRWRLAQQHGQGMRVIADYISGMTDEFATRLHSNLFLSKSGPMSPSLSGF